MNLEAPALNKDGAISEDSIYLIKGVYLSIIIGYGWGVSLGFKVSWFYASISGFQGNPRMPHIKILI